jgi:hypothetical protein
VAGYNQSTEPNQATAKGDRSEQPLKRRCWQPPQ